LTETHAEVPTAQRGPVKTAPENLKNLVLKTLASSTGFYW